MLDGRRCSSQRGTDHRAKHHADNRVAGFTVAAIESGMCETITGERTEVAAGDCADHCPESTAHVVSAAGH
jgi:hypothetical protein